MKTYHFYHNMPFFIFQFHNNINAISLSGYCVSTCVLFLSLFIFFYFRYRIDIVLFRYRNMAIFVQWHDNNITYTFRALNCGRIKMHKNFFTSLTLNNICWIVWYSDIINTTSNNGNDTTRSNSLEGNPVSYCKWYYNLQDASFYSKV